MIRAIVVTTAVLFGCVGLADHAQVTPRKGSPVAPHERACEQLTVGSRVADGVTVGLTGATVASIETGRPHMVSVVSAGLAVTSALVSSALGEWRGHHCEPGFR